MMANASNPTLTSEAQAEAEAMDNNTPMDKNEAQAAEDNAAMPDNESEQKIKSLQEQLLRLQADFDNFRKRVDSEKADLYKYGAEKTINQLLPVLDNLQRGSGSLSESSDPKLLYQSFKMLYTQLVDSLSAHGLKKIESIGKPFDPFYHEAVQREHSSDYAENVVMMEHQPGYLLHDRVIRAAMVVVSAGPADADNGDNPFQN